MNVAPGTDAFPEPQDGLTASPTTGAAAGARGCPGGRRGPWCSRRSRPWCGRGHGSGRCDGCSGHRCGRADRRDGARRPNRCRRSCAGPGGSRGAGGVGDGGSRGGGSLYHCRHRLLAGEDLGGVSLLDRLDDRLAVCAALDRHHLVVALGQWLGLGVALGRRRPLAAEALRGLITVAHAGRTYVNGAVVLATPTVVRLSAPAVIRGVAVGMEEGAAGVHAGQQRQRHGLTDTEISTDQADGGKGVAVTEQHGVQQIVAEAVVAVGMTLGHLPIRGPLVDADVLGAVLAGSFGYRLLLGVLHQLGLLLRSHFGEAGNLALFSSFGSALAAAAGREQKTDDGYQSYDTLA
jgi:hypothetical protein